MLLWDGHSGWAQVGEPSLHIVLYAAVKWACLKCSKQLQSQVWNPGSAGTGDQSVYLWSLQSGNLTAEELPSWQLRAPRECSKRQKVKVATFLRPGPRSWHSNISAIFYWSKQSQSLPRLKGGAKIPLLNRWYVEAFAAIFNPPQCLAPHQYPVSVYWMVHRFGSILDPEKWHNGKRYWVKEKEFKNECIDWGHGIWVYIRQIKMEFNPRHEGRKLTTILPFL